jgi:RecA-family ATPase
MDNVNANCAGAKNDIAPDKPIETAPLPVGWQAQGPALDKNGYELVPIQPGTKRPKTPRWSEINFNNKGFQRIFGGFGVGVKGTKTPGVDLDISDETLLRKMKEWFHKVVGPAPIRIGRPPRAMLVFKSNTPLRRRTSVKFKSPNGDTHQIELIGKGAQFVAYATHPDTGQPYTWPERELTDIPASNLPEITEAQWDAAVEYFYSIVPSNWVKLEDKKVELSDRSKAREHQSAAKLTAPIHELKAAMEVIPIMPENYVRWSKIGMALYHATEGSQEGFWLWDTWSAKGDKYKPDEMEGKWQSFGRSPPAKDRRLGAATIFGEAYRYDPAWRERVDWSRPEWADKLAKLRSLSTSQSNISATQIDQDAGGADRVPDLLNIVSLASYHGKQIPERRWIVEGLIPDLNVSDLSGDGGTGKSLLALQLAVAVAAGKLWLGRKVESGPVVYLSCEDDVDEIRRRCLPILAAQNLTLSQVPNLMLADLTSAAEGSELAILDKQSGRLITTELYKKLEAYVVECCPKLVIIDTRADVFAGNEIDRIQVRTFIRTLRKLCITHDLSVLMLSHPSITGITMGSGQSGSTAWGNSVRSRLYLERANNKGSVPDPDARTLTVMKNNYGPAETEIMLRWRGGLFEPDGAFGQLSVDRLAQDRMVEEIFLRLMEEFRIAGQRVGIAKSANYAPALFASRSEAETKAGRLSGVGKVSSREFAAAMERLLMKGNIRIEEDGPPSRRRSYLVRVN